MNASGGPSVTSLCTYTRNRTKSFQRWLNSYAQSARKHGRQIRLVVADQSDTPSDREANVEALRSISKSFQIPCFYAANDEKEEFARQLAKHAGVSTALARFAICHDEKSPGAYGANRNALLLSTVGELTVHATDDTFCALTAAENPRQSLKLTSELKQQELCYLTDEEHSLYENRPDSDDVISAHEQLLGRSLSNCIEQYSSENNSVDLSECKVRFWGRLQPRLIAMTCAGIVGDSPMGTPYWVLLSQGKARDSLVRSEQHYRFSLARQVVSRSVKQLTICDRGWTGGPCEGLDNRQFLPPFTPIQRGEDIIFGLLVELSGSGYLGYLPSLVHHKRPSNHDFRMADVIEYATRSCSYTIMKRILVDCQFPNQLDPAKNLVAVGRTLQDFGSLSRREFHQTMRQKLTTHWQEQIEQIEERLACYDGQPHFWAADLTSCLDSLKSAVNSASVTIGSDMTILDGNSDCLGAMQKYVTDFGMLLESWSDLRKASLELHSRGIQLARPVSAPVIACSVPTGSGKHLQFS
jgi:hypothetical protein